MPESFKKFTSLFIALSVVLVVGLFVAGSYNSFIRSSEATDTQWAQVETQYQRRFDLVPNLVASVQGVMKQETTIFTAIANARQGYAGARTTAEKVEATSQMEGALGRLLVITENYPQLKSSENVQSLMAQLEGTENRISVERMRYNDMVKDYNIKVKSFPASMLAKLFGFDIKKTFEAESGASTVPKVQL